MLALHVDAGSTIDTRVDVRPMVLNNPGRLYAEDARVATVSGTIASRTSATTARFTGIRPGRTRLMMATVSGMTVAHVAVGTIVVDEPCHARRRAVRS